MTQSDSHTQKLNAGNEGKAIGRAIGISTGSSDRPIVQNLSFFDNTAPTQGGNDVAIIVSTIELQCATSVNAASVQRSAHTMM